MIPHHTTYSRLRELRRGARMTQASLTDAMRAAGHRWHQTTVHRVERGRQPLKHEEATDLAGIFGVPLGALTAREIAA